MHRVLTCARAFLGSAALAAGALAQGADNCASPTAISGLGNFSFNNLSATTGAQGQAYAICDSFGLTAITRDVWFNWTAPSSGQFEFATCGGTGMDSKLAVYGAAGCPAAPPLACNDDSCNAQSRAHITATAGSVYAIQLGNYPGTNPSSGMLNVGVYTPPAPCSVSVGPDVIVGDIQDIENNNPTGGLDAISLGTTSCNIGTVNLGWHANTNQHPVIGGNLYVFRTVNGAGRFEQIGMSWLKHGFLALSEELCCTNCQATGGTELGVNCSDPYTANRNGGQSQLGPRYQVNPSTGFFNYPPASPSWSGNTARRLEFVLTDVVTTAGTRYFGECQYITPDDAAAGNQNNNASYRELTVGGTATNRSFNLSGSTQRSKSAIRAWPVAEPGVVLNDVQVPGDGLFIVGHHTTSLGAGQYHYEFAVYNMNSDRSGGSFSIPIPVGVTVTNVGFHDIAYRNGDGNSGAFVGTDWTSTLAGGTLTWACETQAANNNANALRWGTTYNFRFDADVAPTSGLATLGLWKTGSPATITTPVDVPGGAPVSAAFCFGDGSGTACPCANDSSPLDSSGCLHSLGTAGKLVTTGTASVSADTLALVGTNMPNSSALYFQGTTQANGGLGAVFGDGLRCAGGSIVRLGLETNAGGTSQYPTGLDLPVHVKGAVAAGNVRTYQCWFRNAAAFCSPDTFNTTNGWRLTWLP